jgi:hypothetical protein
VFRRSSVKFLAALAAAAALGVSAPAASPATHSPGQAVASACKPAKIDGQHRCLRVGEFCKHAADRQYRHYGFRCIKYYRNVHRYRLTYA